jgi:hypothetical protein
LGNDGDEAALAPGFDAEHAKAVLGVGEGHPVDQGPPGLTSSSPWISVHAAVMEINAWVRYQDQLGSANAIKLGVVITARALSADGAVALVSRRRSIALGRKISPNSPEDLSMRSIRLA